MAGMTMTGRTTQSPFEGLMRALPQRTTRLVKQTADAIQTVETALCPYDAGNTEKGHIHLRDTIHQEPQGPYTIDVVEGTGLKEAVPLFTEFGTIHMAARPHITPARAAAMPAFEAGTKALLVP